MSWGSLLFTKREAIHKKSNYHDCKQSEVNKVQGMFDNN